MTPIDLAKKCVAALEAGIESIDLVLPRRASGARRMVVFKKPRIYGELLCENSDGHSVVRVDALEILALLSVMKVVNVSMGHPVEHGFAKVEAHHD